MVSYAAKKAPRGSHAVLYRDLWQGGYSAGDFGIAMSKSVG